MACRQTLVKLIFFPSFPSVFKAEHLSLHSFSILFRAGSVKILTEPFPFYLIYSGGAINSRSLTLLNISDKQRILFLLTLLCLFQSFQHPIQEQSQLHFHLLRNPSNHQDL